jgi:hypothetical protein
MPDFCVNKNAQPSGEHEVHNLDAGCFNLPSPANQRALGSHAGCRQALASARTSYANVDGCAWCGPACHAR